MTNQNMGPGHEFDLIRRMLKVWGELATGIGSDTASIIIPSGTELVASTDSSIEGVHFRREWLTSQQVGYRATAAALSDLAAAGANPLGVLLAIGLPPNWIDEIDALAEGIGEAVRSTGARILGGDTTRASELTIAVSVLGYA